MIRNEQYHIFLLVHSHTISFFMTKAIQLTSVSTLKVLSVVVFESESVDNDESGVTGELFCIGGSCVVPFGASTKTGIKQE